MLCVLYWCWKIFLFFADIYKGGNEGCYLPAVREVIHVKKINSVKSTFWSLNKIEWFLLSLWLLWRHYRFTEGRLYIQMHSIFIKFTVKLYDKNLGMYWWFYRLEKKLYCFRWDKKQQTNLTPQNMKVTF